MDKTLNAITSSSSFNFRSKAVSLFRHHFFTFQPRPNSRHFPLSLSNTRSIPFCSLSGNCKVNVSPTGAGEAVREVPQNKFLQVVLVSPQIPGNTGCIARSCAASGVKLHLIEPLGFQVDDTKLKRAGLDYWPYPLLKPFCHFK
ncbi:hypothetical protein ACJIZ3_007654 [Penstemon smallii]|uniref:tRNA/rRNA methyltransferase SpoU type domain-containing protein n=1 Tax=Penstemon smallii TaxID=265156 RepID=A0ABD3T913_9LAMI